MIVFGYLGGILKDFYKNRRLSIYNFQSVHR